MSHTKGNSSPPSRPTSWRGTGRFADTVVGYIRFVHSPHKQWRLATMLWPNHSARRKINTKIAYFWHRINRRFNTLRNSQGQGVNFWVLRHSSTRPPSEYSPVSWAWSKEGSTHPPAFSSVWRTVEGRRPGPLTLVNLVDVTLRLVNRSHLRANVPSTEASVGTLWYQADYHHMPGRNQAVRSATSRGVWVGRECTNPIWIYPFKWHQHVRKVDWKAQSEFVGRSTPNCLEIPHQFNLEHNYKQERVYPKWKTSKNLNLVTWRKKIGLLFSSEWPWYPT